MLRLLLRHQDDQRSIDQLMAVLTPREREVLSCLAEGAERSDVAEQLRGTPRGDKLYRALECTYLKPAPTHELAAERLGLPFNMYRYQLAAAVKYVCEALWQREVGAE